MFNSRCTSSKIPPVKKFFTVKLDSGASKHYFRPCDVISLKNVQNVKNETLITLLDGNNIKIQQKGHLPLHPSIDTRAGEVNIVPHLRSASLLSVGQFTNFGCTAELSYNKAIIKKPNDLSYMEQEISIMVSGMYVCLSFSVAHTIKSQCSN